RHVIVGTDGKILGDVTAQIVVCGGVIEGNVCADMLEVLAPAFIKGDIRAKKMIVEEGGRIEGLCVIGGATEEAAEEEQEEDDEDGKKSKK
ncbi:MAG: polymer-forming cytoskeletal protein, partial [Elusimicrobiaceae bacterium]|nr:polymer-forming cytoskeletal protein [Elusimicrobiaceae bacterium]